MVVAIVVDKNKIFGIFFVDYERYKQHINVRNVLRNCSSFFNCLFIQSCIASYIFSCFGSLWTITYNFVHIHINEYFLNHHREISLILKNYRKENQYTIQIYYSTIHPLHFLELCGDYSVSECIGLKTVCNNALWTCLPL